MKTGKSERGLRAALLAKMNIKHNSWYHIVLAVLVLALTPVLFGTSALEAREAAVPLEMFVALTGIILLTPVFRPEQNREIEELVSSKYTGPIVVFVIRTLYSAAALALLILIFGVYMRASECEVSAALLSGTFADAVFLGGLGMLTAALTENTAAAYMMPVAYYALCFGGGERLGKFWLFSMTHGDYTGKTSMLAAGVLMASLAIWVKEAKRRWR